MASSQQIQKQNLEAELVVIRSDIAEGTTELTSILSNIQSHRADRASFETAKKDFESYKKKTEEELQSKSLEVQKQKQDSEKLLSESKIELEKITKILKDANKTLGWVNDKIFKGEEEFSILQKRKEELDSAIKKLVELLVHQEEEQKKLDDIISRKGQIESELATKERLSKESVEKIKKELSDLKEEHKTSSVARDLVQAELKTYTDKLYTSMNDWQTVRTRLEVRFKEHYPELDLPLMM